MSKQIQITDNTLVNMINIYLLKITKSC